MADENRVRGTRKTAYEKGPVRIVRIPEDVAKFYVYRCGAEKGDPDYSEKSHSVPHSEGNGPIEGMSEWASWYCFNKRDDGTFEAELDEAWWWGGGHNDGGTMREEIPEEWMELPYEEFLDNVLTLVSARHYMFTVEDLLDREGLREFFGFRCRCATMRGLLLYNGYSDLRAYDHQIERLSEEFRKRGVPIDKVKNKDFRFHIKGGSVAYDGRYDFCIFLDKDLYTSIMVEKLGIPIFNNPSAIEICDDKMLTYLALSGTGLRLPDTTPGPLYYDPGMPVDVDSLDVLEGRYQYPMVVKESFGSSGMKVYIVNDRSELLDKLTELRGRMYLVQEFIDSSVGEDLRVIVIGGKVLGGMLRRSTKDFRSNAALGGTTSPMEVPEASIEISERVADILDLDYCGVDLLKDEKGEYTIVCEVNSNAFFESFEGCTGINVAGAYADHIIESAFGRHTES